MGWICSATSISVRQPRRRRYGAPVALDEQPCAAVVAHQARQRQRLIVDAQPHRRGVTEDHARSEEHTSELQSHVNLVCRLLLEKKKKHKSEQARECLYR